MKKVSVCLFAFLLLFISLGAVSESWRVFDNAGLFTEEDIQIIEQQIFSFQRDTNFDFAVLTTDDYLGKDNMTVIADSFYDSHDFGFGRNASGMLYYIDMNQRIPCISTTGELICILDSELNDLHEACHSFLKEGKYKDAVIKMIECVTKAVNEYKQ